MLYYTLQTNATISIAATPPATDPIEYEHPFYSPRLRRCTTLQDGKCIHAQMAAKGLDQDPPLANQVMAMYSKLHSAEEARRVFDSLCDRNVFSWAIVIAAYARNGHCKEALNLFYTMSLEGFQANEVILNTIVVACTRLRHLPLAKSIQWIVLSSGCAHHVVVGTSLLHMYGKCGDLQQARKVFDEMPVRNVITWNAMIKAYAHAGQIKVALELFQVMDARADNITFLSLLQACRRCKNLEATKAVHIRAVQLKLDDDELVVSALVDTYAKCGSFEDARNAFEKLKTVDLVCWTAMIGAYTQFGHPQETLALFRKMDHEGLKADVVTFVNVLSACGSLGSIEQGELLRDRIVSEGLDSNQVIATALSTMYRKCGNLKEAGATTMPASNDSVCWNGMISAYAQHGHKSYAQNPDAQNGHMALELLWEMQLHGVEAGRVTYVSTLHACSHNGLLDEAREAIIVMQEEGRLAAGSEHFACIADALARVGRLEDAHELLQFMPFEPDVDNWRTLLAACVLHGDSERATAAAAALLRLAPQLHETYIMLSNAFAPVIDMEI